jgi:hypothetical protein
MPFAKAEHAAKYLHNYKGHRCILYRLRTHIDKAIVWHPFYTITIKQRLD